MPGEDPERYDEPTYVEPSGSSEKKPAPKSAIDKIMSRYVKEFSADRVPGNAMSNKEAGELWNSMMRRAGIAASQDKIELQVKWGMLAVTNSTSSLQQWDRLTLVVGGVSYKLSKFVGAAEDQLLPTEYRRFWRAGDNIALLMSLFDNSDFFQMIKRLAVAQGYPVDSYMAYCDVSDSFTVVSAEVAKQIKVLAGKRYAENLDFEAFHAPLPAEGSKRTKLVPPPPSEFQS